MQILRYPSIPTLLSLKVMNDSLDLYHSIWTDQQKPPILLLWWYVTPSASSEHTNIIFLAVWFVSCPKGITKPWLLSFESMAELFRCGATERVHAEIAKMQMHHALVREAKGMLRRTCIAQIRKRLGHGIHWNRFLTRLQPTLVPVALCKTDNKNGQIIRTWPTFEYPRSTLELPKSLCELLRTLYCVMHRRLSRSSLRISMSFKGVGVKY